MRQCARSARGFGRMKDGFVVLAYVRAISPDAMVLQHSDLSHRHQQHSGTLRGCWDRRPLARFAACGISVSGACVDPGQPIGLPEIGASYCPGRLKPTFTIGGHAGIQGRCQSRRQAHRDRRSRASPGVSSMRLSSARHLSSTLPSANPLGPTRICHGIPIKSVAANFAPGRSSRSL
jgi:hypothetical protein